MSTRFSDWLDPLPLIAILRGVQPDEVIDIAGALIDNGFRIVEVPLNSPEPLASIEHLATRFGDHILVGAGTVLRQQSVADVGAAGGKLIVMPHADAGIVRMAKVHGLFAVPGFSTPTEAFNMLDAGADALKLFPAEASPPQVLKAIRAVLPAETAILPVGGITPDKIQAYAKAGAHGFGLGSALYRPGMTPGEVGKRAADFCDALRKVVGDSA